MVLTILGATYLGFNKPAIICFVGIITVFILFYTMTGLENNLGERVALIKKTQYGRAIKHLKSELNKHDNVMSGKERVTIYDTIRDLWHKAHYDLDLVKLEIPAPELPDDTTARDGVMLLNRKYRELLLAQTNSDTIKQRDVDMAIQELENTQTGWTSY